MIEQFRPNFEKWAMTNGKMYAIKQHSVGNVFAIEDDEGIPREFPEYTMNDRDDSPALDFEWHSRPIK